MSQLELHISKGHTCASGYACGAIIFWACGNAGGASF